MCIISFITAVWLGLYMGWAAHTLRIVPRFTNSLLACCGKEYEDVSLSRCAMRSSMQLTAVPTQRTTPPCPPKHMEFI